MIVDFPASKDFHSIANEWLIQSFQIIYDYSEELEYLGDWKDEDWHFHKGKLSTALVLIHQSVEAKLKGEICGISPYFLLDIKPQEWPTLPNSRDRNFNELFTIGSEALLRVYLGLCKHKGDTKELVTLFEKVRVTRNKIVHGLHKDYLEPRYLLDLQFQAAREVFGLDFWTFLKEEERRHPLYRELRDDDLISALYYKLNFVERYLGSKRLKLFLSVSGRSYKCPRCTRRAQDWDYGSVYLAPNTPEARVANCIICDYKFDIQRRRCESGNCRGNVIWASEESETEICLSCLDEN